MRESLARGVPAAAARRRTAGPAIRRTGAPGAPSTLDSRAQATTAMFPLLRCRRICIVAGVVAAAVGVGAHAQSSVAPTADSVYSELARLVAGRTADGAHRIGGDRAGGRG
jgi:hypothetical protein